MNLGIEGKTAFVGASSKGLGKGVAVELAKNGVNIILCARNEKSLLQTAREIENNYQVKVYPVQMDLTNINEIGSNIERAKFEMGEIDILVTNTGGPKIGSFFEVTKEDWQAASNQILYQLIELYRLIIPAMKTRQWGRIINVTSLTVKEPAEKLILSNVFRVGVISLSKSLTHELIKHNITINNICPGSFNTDRAISIIENNAKNNDISYEEAKKMVEKGLPSGRMQEPWELGSYAAFLASDLACGITGTTLQIDGGIYKGLF